MRKMLTVMTFAAMMSPFAFAASWSGDLVDSSCYDTQNAALKDTQKTVDACPATSTTTSFALHATGKVYKLDSAGNSKAMAALKNRADRSTPGAAAGAAAKEMIHATVEGTESAGTIKVDSVDIR